jgi:hypothetical protein
MNDQLIPLDGCDEDACRLDAVSTDETVSGDDGIVGQLAPEFVVDEWLTNVDGPAFGLADIETPFVYLYFFQQYCPACHLFGFRTLKDIRSTLVDDGLDGSTSFVAIQTVFQQHDVNTAAAAQIAIRRHRLHDIPFGHAASEPGARPQIMVDYAAPGTPWAVLIGPDRSVVANGFRLFVGPTVELIKQTLAVAH